MRGRKKYWVLAGSVIFVLMLMLLILLLQIMSIEIPSTVSDSFEISASIATVCAALGAFWTIYEARNTSAGELVLELQKEFSDSYGMKVYMKCWNEYSNKIYGETIELENKVKTLTFLRHCKQCGDTKRTG